MRQRLVAQRRGVEVHDEVVVGLHVALEQLAHEAELVVDVDHRAQVVHLLLQRRLRGLGGGQALAQRARGGLLQVIQQRRLLHLDLGGRLRRFFLHLRCLGDYRRLRYLGLGVRLNHHLVKQQRVAVVLQLFHRGLGLRFRHRLRLGSGRWFRFRHTYRLGCHLRLGGGSHRGQGRHHGHHLLLGLRLGLLLHLRGGRGRLGQRVAAQPQRHIIQPAQVLQQQVSLDAAHMALLCHNTVGHGTKPLHALGQFFDSVFHLAMLALLF